MKINTERRMYCLIVNSRSRILEPNDDANVDTVILHFRFSHFRPGFPKLKGSAGFCRLRLYQTHVTYLPIPQMLQSSLGAHALRSDAWFCTRYRGGFHVRFSGDLPRGPRVSRWCPEENSKFILKATGVAWLFFERNGRTRGLAKHPNPA
jgi:hypothetical protein